MKLMYTLFPNMKLIETCIEGYRDSFHTIAPNHTPHN